MKNSTLLFCGDIMPGGMLHYKKEYLSEALLNLVKSASIRIATLEAALGDNFAFNENKMSDRCNIVYATNSDIGKLLDLNINVVSLANNHIFDLGYDGFVNTINLLNKHNIKFCGAGRNIVEASRPVEIFVDGESIAIYAYCMYASSYIGVVPIADDRNYGVNPLDVDKVINDIKIAKTKYDYVVVMPHWGREFSLLPLDMCRDMAFKMIEAGADAIIGSHPHAVQPIIKYKQKYIAFSLGNFLFPDFYMKPPRPIWYPDSKENLTKVPRVFDYPFPINEPMVQVWNDYSRIGLALKFNIGKKRLKIIRKSFVKLDSNNFLDLHKLNFKYSLKLRIAALVTKYKLINLLFMLYLKIRNM